MASILDRVIRAARLDASLYEEVEADPSQHGTGDDGGGVGQHRRRDRYRRHRGPTRAVLGLILNLIGWYIWAFLTYFIGTRLLPQPSTEADIGQLLRTLGFAAAPGLLRVAGVVPAIGPLVFVITAFWSLATMVVAVRQALDYDSTSRAILVFCAIGWIVQLLIIMIPFFVIGSFSPSVHSAPAA